MTNEHRLQTDNAGIKQMISQTELWSMKWIPGTEQLADCLKKKGANSLNLKQVLQNGQLHFSTQFTFSVFPNYDLLLMLCSYSDKIKWLKKCWANGLLYKIIVMLGSVNN